MASLVTNPCPHSELSSSPHTSSNTNLASVAVKILKDIHPSSKWSVWRDQCCFLYLIYPNPRRLTQIMLAVPTIFAGFLVTAFHVATLTIVLHIQTHKRNQLYHDLQNTIANKGELLDEHSMLKLKCVVCKIFETHPEIFKNPNQQQALTQMITEDLIKKHYLDPNIKDSLMNDIASLVQAAATAAAALAAPLAISPAVTEAIAEAAEAAVATAARRREKVKAVVATARAVVESVLLKATALAAIVALSIAVEIATTATTATTVTAAAALAVGAIIVLVMYCWYQIP